MPRGIDRRGDPRNDLTREGIAARLVSQTQLTRDAIPGVRISNYTDPEPAGSLDLNTGDLYDVGGKPVVGRAADLAKQKEKLTAEDRAWREWHADYEEKRES